MHMKMAEKQLKITSHCKKLHGNPEVIVHPHSTKMTDIVFPSLYNLDTSKFYMW